MTNFYTGSRTLEMNNFKSPPLLEDDAAYECWKNDINIWCELTELPVEKQALAIHLSLTGRARVSSSEMQITELKHKDVVSKLLEKLDTLFLVDKGRRQFSAFNALYNLRRASDANISSFVAEFEHTYYKFKQQDMTLPDTVMAFMLLAACNFSEKDRQLVMSATN